MNKNIKILTKQADNLLDLGNLPGAYDIFDEISRLDSANSDAWLMKGSIKGELGDVTSAVEFIKKAIEIEPDYAEAHFNLANIFRVQGDINSAVFHLESAISSDKDFFEAYQMLSGLTGQLGQTDACEEYAKEAVRLKPDSIESNINLANALQQNDKQEESIKYYQRIFELTSNPPEIIYFMLGRAYAVIRNFDEAIINMEKYLELQPNVVDAWIVLADALKENNALKQALNCYEKVLDIQPDNELAKYQLAVICHRTGELSKAVTLYQSLITNRPEEEQFHINIGRVYKEMADLENAQIHFHNAVKLNPENIDALNEIANVFQIEGRYEDAITYNQKCKNIQHDYIQAYLGLSACYVALGRQDEAYLVCEEALKLEPDNSDVLISSAISLMTLGREKEALTNAQKALESNPGHSEAKSLLCTLYNHLSENDKAYDVIKDELGKGSILSPNLALAYSGISKSINHQEEAIAVLENVLNLGEKLSLKAKVSINFALGKQYDSIGNYALAFQHYRQGNELKPITFDRSNHESMAQGVIKYFTKGYMRQMPHSTMESEKPIFIVGMPRSGTSLVEQILSSHDDIYGAGELPEIIKISKAIGLLLKSNSQYPDCLEDVTVELLDGFAENYLALIDSYSHGEIRVIDKMPGNFMHLGLIEMLFPNAKIIHCMRNPIDTCLSGYFQDFSRSHSYSYDLNNLAIFYNNYRKVMSHWNDVSNLEIFELNYEDLVDQQEEYSKKLVEFCGLTWDEKCLNFHETERFIGTASYDQVRQPIYKKSMQRWKNYEQYLSPLIEGLDPSLSN